MFALAKFAFFHMLTPRPVQVPGKIPRLFEEARSWVQEHYDAVAICPALAHECKIPQDGPYTPPKTTPNVPRRPSVAD